MGAPCPRRRRRDLAGLAAGGVLLAAGAAGLITDHSVSANVGRLAPVFQARSAAAGGGAGEPAPTATLTATPTPAPAPAPAPTRTLPPPRAGFSPVSLTVPAIDLQAPVVPVEAPSGVLGVPPDPDVLGWWSAGSRPGDGVGAVVLAGHLDSHQHGRGPLYRATELRPGDTGRVAGARGQQRDYEVVAVRTFRKQQLPSGLFARAGEERLVLVTCGGRYDAERGGWDSNVVVVMDALSINSE